jgi:hypothetical protein
MAPKSMGDEAPTMGCFAIARLQYGGGGDWYAGPSMLANLHTRVQKDLKLKTCTEENVVQLSDPNLFRYPILFMTGHGQVTFSAEERRLLRLYLLPMTITAFPNRFAKK